MIKRNLDEANGVNGQSRFPLNRREASQTDQPESEKVGELQAQAMQLITKHPVVALGAAVVAGLAVGWWVKRK